MASTTTKKRASINRLLSQCYPLKTRHLCRHTCTSITTALREWEHEPSTATLLACCSCFFDAIIILFLENFMIAANLITHDVYLIERNVCSQACWGFLSVHGAAVCTTYRCACRGAHNFRHRDTYRKLVIHIIIIIIIPCTKRNYNRIFVAREKIEAKHRMQREKNEFMPPCSARKNSIWK